MDEKLASYTPMYRPGYNWLEGKEFSKRSGSMMRRVREFFESKNTERKKNTGLIDGKCLPNDNWLFHPTSARKIRLEER